MAGIFEKEYKVRRAARCGYETTISSLWVEKMGVHGKKIKHVFDSNIYVLVPPSVEVDWKKLTEAVFHTCEGGKVK